MTYELSDAERAALAKINEGYAQLLQTGWKPMVYVTSSNGINLLVIEPGSGGVHSARCLHGHWFEITPSRRDAQGFAIGGTVTPINPILYRVPETSGDPNAQKRE